MVLFTASCSKGAWLPTDPAGKQQGRSCVAVTYRPKAPGEHGGEEGARPAAPAGWGKAGTGTSGSDRSGKPRAHLWPAALPQVAPGRATVPARSHLRRPAREPTASTAPQRACSAGQDAGDAASRRGRARPPPLPGRWLPWGPPAAAPPPPAPRPPPRAGPRGASAAGGQAQPRRAPSLAGRRAAEPAASSPPRGPRPLPSCRSRTARWHPAAAAPPGCSSRPRPRRPRG